MPLLFDQAVWGNISDMIAVQVKPEQPFKWTKKVRRNTGDLVFTQEKCCQGVPKVEVITICQVHDLIPESSRYITLLFSILIENITRRGSANQATWFYWEDLQEVQLVDCNLDLKISKS